MAQTALITGASAGLGAEFARLFAADRHDLVLVARRRDRLEALGKELSQAHGIRVEVIDADLGAASPGNSTEAGTGRVIAEVARLGVEVDFLVNNAGFGLTGAFATLDGARQLEMVQVNITALMALTHAFLPGMISRRRGRVLNIGSTAGFQPGPYMATYYASKAFVNTFTEALWFELRDSGVTATVSCPGATATEFAAVAGNDATRLFKTGGVASAAEVAREAYVAMNAGKPMVIHGLKNQLGVQALRFSPRAAVLSIAASLNKP